ncbi:MAG: phage holin, LLH family, partial [Oscillospiraceae bacterium]|nr:phage holin, LLH family [Oscillospiraceae bacterium]
ITAVIIVLAVAVIVVMTCYTCIYLTKHRVNVQGGLQTADAGLSIANTVTDALKVAMPSNKVVSVIDKVVDYAQTGVKAAEQMAKSGQITADQRKAQANQYITTALNYAGIEVTPEIQTAIDGAVECAVAALPKSNLPAPAKVV